MNDNGDHVNVFNGLQPYGLWKHFEAITRIPRPSKGEEKMARYVLDWAQSKRFVASQDSAGNIVVQVPATSGRERADVIVLQAHLDMVCERVDSSAYDATAGNILTLRVGNWLVAPETTLGADNGIGIAAMLWIAENGSMQRGPLDLLFTVDEETGLTGAAQLTPALVRGRTLLNLDCEEDSTICVGCAGGANSRIHWSAPIQAVPAGWRGTQISVGGLLGGHSGMEIQKNRLNAIKAITRILQTGNVPMLLSTITGGNKSNAIPREACATIFHHADCGRVLRETFEDAADLLTRQFQGLDNQLVITIGDAPVPAAGVFSETQTRQLLDFLRAMPSGVLAMSADLPGLVESSTNLALVKRLDETSMAGQGTVEILSSSRSSVAPALRDILDSIHSTARLIDAEVHELNGYPGWKPNLKSRVLNVICENYQRLFGASPTVTAVHAGVECGLLGEKIPMDMISIGPTIEGVHAPGEKVSVPSVEKFCSLLTAVLDSLSS